MGREVTLGAVGEPLRPVPVELGDRLVAGVLRQALGVVFGLLEKRQGRGEERDPGDPALAVPCQVAGGLAAASRMRD